MDALDLTVAFALNPAAPTARLFPIQSRMLAHLIAARGLVAFVGVGRGKTLPVLLAATAWGCRHPLILTAASLVPQLEAEWERWSKHFRLVPAQIRSHHLLSTVSGAREFAGMDVDCLVIDEADAFCGKGSARTKLLFKAVRAANAAGRPLPMAVLSGTLLRDSVRGPDHLSVMTLRNRTPLPAKPVTLEALAAAVDPPENGEPRAAPGLWQPLCDAYGEADLRGALGRRLVDTVGVVISQDELPLPALNIRMRQEPLPAPLKAAWDKVLETWCLPDGQEMKLALELFTCLRQLASGFYTRPRWNTEDGRPDLEWLEARTEWSRTLTHALGDREENATRARLEARAEAGEWAPRAWKEWQKIRDRHGEGGPPRETVWVDKGWLQNVAARLLEETAPGAAERGPCVVWVRHRATAAALHQLLGWPYFGEGEAAARALMLEDGTRSIICSIPAHGKGKNLQQFHVAHWLEVPGSNHVCEQLLGRHHRYGQLANAVDVHMWAGTWLAHRALQRATEKDRLVAETTKERRKLLYATRVGVFEDAEPLIDVDALFDDERA